MSQTTKNGHPKVSLATAVIVYGLDAHNKPQAARFPERLCDLAIKAAQQLKLNVLPVTSPDVAEFAADLPVGRINSSGRGLVPYVRQNVYDKVLELAHAADPAQPAPAPGLPRSWNEIDVGHLVIAFENKDDGWWEAIVIETNNDMLTLRWRDYPKQPTLVRHRAAVALLNPTP